MKMSRWSWSLPLLAAVIAYAMAPWGELVWDDQIVVKQQMTAFQGLADVFRPPAGIPQWSYDYFRPVTLASYLLDIRLFGLGNAWGAHAANVFYHVLTTFFVWLLLSRLLGDRPGAAVAAGLAATLFAVHPIHTESVSWITGRSDLLATMLLLPALYLAVVWQVRRSVPALLVAPVLFLLALLAKEVAIAGLLIVPLLLLVAYDPATEPSPRGWRAGMPALLGVVLPWTAVLVMYFMLRAGGGSGIGAWPDSLAELFGKPAQALAWYLGKLVVPWPQSSFVTAAMLPAAGTVAAILAAVAALLLWAAWYWRRSGDGLAFAGLWWAIIGLAPSLAVTFAGVSVTPVAERYLFLPSAGAALAVAAVLANLSVSRWARPAAGAALLLAVAYLAGTVQRGFVWLSDLRLWTDTTAKVSDHGIPWLELGKARMGAGDESGAIDAFLRARALENTPPIAAIVEFNLGAMYAQRGSVADARQAFEASIAANPAYSRAHYGLGRLLYEDVTRSGGPPSAQHLGPLREAAGHLQQAVDYAPNFTNAYFALARTRIAEGDVLQNIGDPRAALESYRAAARQLDIVRRFDPVAARSSDARNVASLAGQRAADLERRLR